LNEAKVKNIKAALAAGKSQMKIANMYGVSQVMICYIKAGRAWSHVKA